ncbi:DUF2971 domain-containing protein [Orbus sturtevantii]|uniref:tetratricopeptide repeat protein n=1 Tax=Orbus sturtevantii TaxID=3074109 RepID=UPI00370DBA45
MMTEETLEQKIARLSSIQPSDSDYAESQFKLGAIYQNKKKPDIAIKYFENILYDDNPQTYTKAQFRLGLIWQYEEVGGKKIDLNIASEHYRNVHNKDNSILYVAAQFNLGIICYAQQDFNDAKSHFSNVSHIKYDFSLYVVAQFHLGIICYAQQDFNDAKSHFNNVSYIKDGFSFYAEAQIKLYFLANEITEGKEIASSKDIQPLINSITKIYNACKEIRDELFIDVYKNNHYEQTIAHYTNPNVLFSLLKQASLFRLNLVDFMNDPSENKVLLNWLNINPSQTNPDIKNFVASFSFNHNSLNQFRLYGLEDNQPGSGVSLTFNKEFFCDELDKSIDLQAITKSPQKLIKSDIVSEQQSKCDQTIFPLPLYRCIYFDPDTNYLALAKRSKQSFYLEYKSEKPDEIDKKWQDYLKSLKEKQKIKNIRGQLGKIQTEIEKLTKLIDKNGWQVTLKDINQLIALATMPIASLVKHAAFEDENECRIFYVTDIGDDKVKMGEQFDLCRYIYLEYDNIATHVDKIYLGPKCQPQHKLWLDNHNKKNKLNIRRIVQSIMPLQ